METISSTQNVRDDLLATSKIGGVPQVGRSESQPGQGRAAVAPPPPAGVESDTVSQALSPRATEHAASRNEVGAALSAIGAAEVGLAAVDATLQLMEASVRAQEAAADQEKAHLQTDYAALADRIDATVQRSASGGANLLAGESHTAYPGGDAVTITGTDVTSGALGLATSTPSVSVVDTAREQIQGVATVLSSAAFTLSARSDSATSALTGTLDEAVAEEVQANLNVDAAQALATRVQDDLATLSSAVAAQSQAAIAQLI